jgi:hypothetical protein
MRQLGPTAKTILGIFDEGLGGLAAPASVIAKILDQKHVKVSKANLLLTLSRLAKRGELAKIDRPKGGAIYTRPRNLERTLGLHAMLERTPALNIRRKSSTTDLRYELRVKRAVKRFQNAEVRRGVHDHRDPSRPCPVEGCWAWPPEKAEEYLAVRERSKRASVASSAVV